jgi:hypothetical protein
MQGEEDKTCPKTSWILHLLFFKPHQKKMQVVKTM